MPFDGFGNYTRPHNWVEDRDNAIKITAVRHDESDDDIAAALNSVVLRSGVAAMTGNLKMGGQKITGLAAGAAGTPSVSLTGDVTTGMYFPATGEIAWACAGGKIFHLTADGARITGNFGINQPTPRTEFDIVGVMSVQNILEDVIISAGALTGAINVDFVDTAPIFMQTANAAGNWTFNIRGDAGTDLDDCMAVGQSWTFVVEVPQGGTAYYCTDINVDGANPAQVVWFGGPPAAGNVSGIDVYQITVIKTAAATFKVRASLTQATA